MAMSRAQFPEVMGYDEGGLISNYDIIDPFEGKFDLEHRVIRCVGITKERFREDGLRILRAARFIITKGLSPNADLAAEIEDRQWWNFIKETVSTERIREELTKMFKHSTIKTIRFFANSLPIEALIMLEQSGIWLKPTMEKK